MNPNNCATCDYSKYEHEGGHCYMFRHEPADVCMQHTGRKLLSLALEDAVTDVASLTEGQREGRALARMLSNPAWGVILIPGED